MNTSRGSDTIPLAGKTGGTFTSSGGMACGAETARLSMIEAMPVHGMVVQGRHDDKHCGPTATESPNEGDVALCRELSQRVARRAMALKA